MNYYVKRYIHDGKINTNLVKKPKTTEGNMFLMKLYFTNTFVLRQCVIYIYKYVCVIYIYKYFIYICQR